MEIHGLVAPFVIAEGLFRRSLLRCTLYRFIRIISGWPGCEKTLVFLGL